VRPPPPRENDNGSVLLLGLLVLGLGAGWLAQVLLGRGAEVDARTLVAGLLGSLLGGLLASLLAGDGLQLRLSGILGSVLGAVAVLAVWVRVDPAGAAPRRR
jgi:uncharacterized membrane protein YeaQ/YmgE (transglycosylase-associated protein family)